MKSNNNSRLKKEIAMLTSDPGPGVSAWPSDPDNLHVISAQITGPDNSPYSGGVFSLSVEIPDRYPFEPPRVRFVTPVYHPNIDKDGRICLDTLKTPPQGSWSPSVNINTLLLTIRILLEHPNPDDGLVLEITEQYRRDPIEFQRQAACYTAKYAKTVELTESGASGGLGPPLSSEADRSTHSITPSVSTKDAVPPSSIANDDHDHGNANQEDGKVGESDDSEDDDDDEDDEEDEDDSDISDGDDNNEVLSSSTKRQRLS